ncbi:MAG TPA: methyltransferase, partial [Methylocystis sp.]
RHAPQIQIGVATLTLPPGAFLQATQTGEQEIAARVRKATEKAHSIADLFCGVGAFALRLAQRAQVKAYDLDAAAVAAMRAAAQSAQGLRRLEGVERDLFARPLRASELNGFDAIVFDPPRAGAAAQSAEIAQSDVPTVVAVSCSAQSFARDAAILLKGGYVIREITPLDQFRYAAHVEIVATFEKASERKAAKRRLLG